MSSDEVLRLRGGCLASDDGHSTDIIGSKVCRKLLTILVTEVLPILQKRATRMNILAWLRSVLVQRKWALSIPLLKGHGVTSGVVHVLHNVTMSLISAEESVNERCVNLYRLSTLFALAIFTLENTSTYRKHSEMLKNFSLTTLLDEVPMFSTYLVVSTETKGSYIGLVGAEGPRLFSLRVMEHIRGMRNGDEIKLNKSGGGDKEACAKFYRKAHMIGAHKFVMLPCVFEVNSIKELNQLETRWIRRLMPSFNTQKLPFRNISRRCRPNPAVRRGETPIQICHISPEDLHKVPKIIVKVQQEGTQALAKLTRVVSKAKTKNALKRIGGQQTLYSHADLLSVFNLLVQKRGAQRNAILQQKSGNFALTRVTGLVRKFGRSTIEVLHDPQHVLGERLFTLKQFVLRIVRTKCVKYTVRIKTFVVSSPRNSPYYRALVNAATHPTSRDRRGVAEGFDVCTLLKMWTMLRWIQCKSTRARAQDLLLTALRKRDMNPRPNAVLVVPHRDDIVLRELRYIPDTIVKAMNIDPLYKKTIHDETRIAAYRRKNMKDLLVNCRNIAKDTKQEHHTCSCKQVYGALGLTEEQAKTHMTNGHFGIRATDIPENPEIDPLLRGNLKNIPKTDVACLREELSMGAEEWIKKVTPAIQCDKSRPSPIVFKKGYVYIYRYADVKNEDNYMAQVSIARFQRWHFAYCNAKKNRSLFAECHGTNFVNDVVRMVKVHVNNASGTNSKHHWVNHPPLYEKMARVFRLKTEYFASPLNFNLAHDSFFSEFTIDKLFGSNGSAWTHKWHESGEANPIFEDEDIVKTFAYAKKFATLSDKHSFLVTIPLWEWMGKKYLHFINDTSVHPVLTFDEKGYAFHHPEAATRQWKYTKAPHIMAPWGVGLFLVRNTPLTEVELGKVQEIREYLQANGFSPHEQEEMTPFLNDLTVLMPELADVPIPVEKVEKRHLKKWVPNYPDLNRKYPNKIPGAARLQVACDRLKIDYDALLDDCIAKCWKAKKTSSDASMILSPTRWSKLQRKIAQLRKCSSIFELDKNSSCAFFACHCYHMEALDETYINDPHYEEVKKQTEDEVIQRYKNTFLKLKWEAYGNFRKGGKNSKTRLPYGYCLPKNKDVKKRRPIVSYCVHPFAKVLQRASRAIRHMLDICDRKHFTLNKTNDFVSRLESIHQSFMDEGYDHVVMQAGDIKNMYTELEHSEIMKAFDWLIEVAKKRHTEVSVPKCGRHGMRMGRSPYDDFVKFKLKDLRDIVKFDLDNAIFSVRGKILRQKIGIPMGSPLSPILAVLVCAYYESQYLAEEAQLQVRRRVDGARYVDDALFATGYSSPGDKKIAQKAIDHAVKHMYHKNLDIELDEDQNNIHMLESIIDTTHVGTLPVRFWYKNAESVEKHGKQKVLRFQHFDSFSSYSSKKGVIISTLMRMREATNCSETLQQDLLILAKELSLLGYPRNILKSALSLVTCRARERNDETWSNVKLQ